MEISGKLRTAVLVSLVLLVIPSIIASAYFQSPSPVLLLMVLVLTVPRYLWLKGIEGRMARGEGILGPLDLRGKKAIYAVGAGAVAVFSLLGLYVLPSGSFKIVLHVLFLAGLLFANHLIRQNYKKK